MPSVTYMNQSAPFWDFIASLEQQGSQHPMFSRERNEETQHEQSREEEQFGQPPFGPWGWGQFFGGGRGMPYRGPAPTGPPANQEEKPYGDDNQEKEGEKDPEKHAENDNGEGPSGNSGSDNEGRRRHGRCGGRRGRCGPGGPSGFGGPGGFGGPSGFGGPCGRGGFGPRHGPPHGHHHGRGRWGPWGRGGPFGFGGNFDPSNMAAQFWNQFTENDSTNKRDNENEDHTPDADIFDTETAFVVHVSLPGAKKEDVGVNWDAEKSELAIAGVIYRPGDEEFLKTLAMNERKVGAFERKIRLGTRANPANIDADGITAKLEDGVLRVEVPKLDAGYVEVRKVDIE
ncbi:HSP20-like chaperone [Pyrenochaeta sp. DS3sAY3a]|nr:HSP20-like chaperone [Pyrenochaeta sp. DS3sAY3a]